MARYVPQYKRKKTAAQRRLPILLAAILLIALAASAVWGVSAKYIHQNETFGTVKAKMFYFTSDFLSPSNPTYMLNPGSDGKVQVTFELSRMADTLRDSEVEISYNIYVNNQTPAESEATANAGKLTNSNLSDTITLTLNASANAETTYEVKAVAKGGYHKEIYATFVVRPMNQLAYYNVTDYGAYVMLTIWTKNTSGKIAVEAPAGAILDKTGPAPGGDLDKYSSVSYRYFKTGAYGGDFTVTVGEAAATPGTLP